MLLCLCTPIFYLAISALIFHGALNCHHQTHRYYLLPFFILFSSLSVTSSSYFMWIPGLTSLWSQAVIVNVPHTICLLYIRRWPVPHPPSNASSLGLLGRFRHQFETTYRLWSNPQLIGVVSKPNASTKNAPTKTLVFLLLRITKLPIYYYVNSKILPALVSKTFIEITPEDVAPEKQMLLRRLHDISTREFMIRSYVSVLWIWQSLVYLDGSNTLLACFFVAIRLDRPCDWPPLFGNPTSITSLRTFWSRFWHQIAVQPYTHIGTALVHQLGLQPHSFEGKAFVAFVVFGLSGVSHGLVSWQIGRDGRTDIWWFMVMFMACFMESAFWKCISYAPVHSRTLQVVRKSWLSAFFGRVWVFAFLFWSVPKWQYPAMLKEAIQARQMQVWDLIFSKMNLDAV